MGILLFALQVEAELNEMPKEEAAEWLEALGVTDGGLSTLVNAAYKTLGLRTYFTSGMCLVCRLQPVCEYPCVPTSCLIVELCILKRCSPLSMV